MAHTFFLMSQPGQPDRLIVWDTRTLSVGRAPENDLVVEDDEVSRQHAMFERSPEGFTVGDYHTGNGTFVNGERAGQRSALRPGDVVTVGGVRFELVEQDEHPAKRGLRLEYASQLKTVGMLPSGFDPSTTMLGMGGGDAATDGFVIEHERRIGGGTSVVDDLFGEEKPADDDFGFDEIEGDEFQLELDEGLAIDPHAPAAPEPAAPAPPRAAPTPQPAPRPAPPARPAAPASPARPTAAQPRPAATQPPAARPAAPPQPAAPAARPAPASAPARPAASAPARPAAPTRAPAAAPPAAPGRSGAPADPAARMRRLKSLLDEGLITPDEFQAKRAAILAEI